MNNTNSLFRSLAAEDRQQRRGQCASWPNRLWRPHLLYINSQF